MKRALSAKTLWIPIFLLLLAATAAAVLINTPRGTFFSGWSDYNTLLELYEASDLIVVAEAKGFPAEDSQIVQMTVEQAVKGDVRAGDILKVKAADGEKQNPGSRWLLFLRGTEDTSLNLPYTPVNQAQGIYPIEGNNITLSEGDLIFGNQSSLEAVLEAIHQCSASNKPLIS